MATMFNISEREPANKTIGMGWLKPSIGQTFIYINDVWVPIAGGEAQTLYYPLTILISGKNRTLDIDNDTFQKVDNLTSAIDTCGFTLTGDKPAPGEEVIVFQKSSESDTEPEKIFGGEIVTCPQKEIAPGSGTFEYEINCADYSRRLKKRLVTESYTDKTCKYIVDDLIDSYQPEFTTNNVQTGDTIDYISFDHKDVFQCIEEIAELTGQDWYVDYEKDIHLFSLETNTAPYTLDDDISISGRHKDLNIEVDKTQLRNRIFVQGGYYFSNVWEQEETADGIQTSFVCKYEPFTPIKVYVDTGAGYVEKTLGIDNVETSGKDFVINQVEKVIKNLDYATLSNGHKIKITYRYKIPISTEDSDTVSISNLKKLEGGDGYYDYHIVDVLLETLDAAHRRASAELEEYADCLISGSFITDQSGYRSGQLLTVNMSLRGYTNKTYLIQNVTMIKMAGENNFEYQITFATKLKGLTELLREMLDRGKEIVIRPDEVLSDLLKITGDNMTISHADPTFEEHTPPFQYGPGGSPQGRYNEAQYG